MSAPGTLSKDEQTRLMAQVIQLAHTAYGDDTHVVLTVVKRVVNDKHDGVAVFTASTLPDPKMMRSVLKLAATQLEDAEYRKIVIDDGSETVAQ